MAEISLKFLARPITLLICFVLFSLTTMLYTIQYKPSYSTVSAVQINNSTKCEEIHVAMVLLDYSQCRQASTAIKSLLFHRTSKIYLHLLVTLNTHRVMQTLFSTWQLPYFTVKYYKSESFISQVNNQDVKDGIKVMLPHILLDVEKIIVLDSNVLFDADIANLWAYFNKFTSTQCIGMAVNFGSGNDNGKMTVSPTVGQYNFGVALMQLSRLRQTKFNALSHDISINLNRLVFNLPCQWNIQLNSEIKSSMCHVPDTPNLMNYNPKFKFGTVQWSALAKHFQKLRLKYHNYNGNFLRFGKLPNCPKKQRVMSRLDNSVTADDCNEMKAEATIIRRTHLYYLDNYNYTPAGANDVTLVTQFSFDRAIRLIDMANHWPGPISVCVYASDLEAYQLYSFLSSSSQLQKRRNIGLHIVIKDGEYYPVNTLRNIAMDNSQTKLVFLPDIDFLPNYGLHKQLSHNVEELEVAESTIALVVPAFETRDYTFRFPSSKDDLLEGWKSGRIATFLQGIFDAGHAATNFTRWKSATEPYEIQWEVAFEPYIVIHRDAARFDTRFVGFGIDKSSFILMLNAMKYRFFVLPDAFLVHQPHNQALDSIKYGAVQKYKTCIAKIDAQFLKDIADKFGDESVKHFYNYRKYVLDRD